MNRYIGAHVSASGGAENAPVNAGKIGATGFALFTKNQRRWDAPPLTEETIESFRSNMHKGGFSPESVLPHDSYLINLAHPDPEKRRISTATFIGEAERVRKLGLIYLNFHPGSHLNAIETREALKNVARSLKTAGEQVPGVTFLAECTAGQGSNLGARFEELAFLLDFFAEIWEQGNPPLHICLDTCHLHAAGYDMETPEKAAAVFQEFDRTIGFRHLRGMHLNNAKAPAGSRLDRHASIEEGTISAETFRYIVQMKETENIPLILETPRSELWPQEIEMLKKWSSL
ncbi:MAG: deoxyribonuclease IV [Spirochaetaceae bacterium]|jgi:deoxyribonuclease-4|nr:deoxyribonuclease IV [Spirochaetaceae bacterium]